MAIKKLEIDALALLEAIRRALVRTGVTTLATTVSASAVLLFSSGIGPILIKNTGSATVYFGPSPGVTPDNGYPLAAGEELSFTSNGPVALYAICATGQSTSIRVLRGYQ